ncbi:hypothetical protein D3C81_442140 [compost metagenome]
MDIDKSVEAFKAVVIQAQKFTFKNGKFYGEVQSRSAAGNLHRINMIWKAWNYAVNSTPATAASFASVYNIERLTFEGTKFQITGVSAGIKEKAIWANRAWRAWQIALGRDE